MPKKSTILVFDDGQIVKYNREQKIIEPIGVPIILLKGIMEEEKIVDVHKLILTPEQKSNPFLEDEIYFLNQIQDSINEILEGLPTIKSFKIIIKEAIARSYCPSEDICIRNALHHEYNQEWLYILLERYVKAQPKVEELKKIDKKMGQKVKEEEKKRKIVVSQLQRERWNHLETVWRKKK